MPKLDERLKTVARQIRTTTHVDVGSDHGHLLVALLKSGRIKRGIAIENKHQPFENSSRALRGLSAEVRLGTGLAALSPAEADSLSICGMGAESIVEILTATPRAVPRRVILQPNRQPELVRQWALQHGFHLQDERLAKGHWSYHVMAFQHVGEGLDPAYENIDRAAALLFGPLIIRRRDPLLMTQLRAEENYLSRFPRLAPSGVERLSAIRQLLAMV